ncbi:P-loop containing nucleoside triphosphate hydrolase protein [Apodospora peruviana]|uniref:P-loop containing nucleoside triphosphate hydrolase protein n=1 Tax=Apodospora peruviana TaxID=516989 RepID=A0AAE0M413_9PEZI|nr:P-loop containing nucleoside triphosphate hydrolase protein [Apodospora peruviana]
MKTLEFRIRKLHVNTDVEKRLQKKQPSRVYVGEDALIELTGSRDGGKAIYIERASASPDEPPVRREATLWKAPEKLDKAVTQMYDAFRDACGYRLGEQVKITALGSALPEADEVILEELTLGDSTQQPSAPEPIAPSDIPGWEVFLAGRLSLVEHVYAGLVFKNVFLRGPERSFVVASVNGRATGNGRYLDRRTTLKISDPTAAEEKLNQIPQGELKVVGIQGLDSQIKKLNNLLGCFTEKNPIGATPRYPGIVIHGGHGTGKSLLLKHVGNAGWGTVHWIQFKDKLTEIQDVFQKARLQQPSIVLIDQLERLIDKERNNRGAVIQTICEALDSLAEDTELKGDAPKVIVISTCLDYTTDVPEDLKEPGRFTSEIYLPLPGVDGRKEILASFNLHVEPAKEQELLHHLSERTHAYNGKDLRRLVDEAHLLGRIRIREERRHYSHNNINNNTTAEITQAVAALEIEAPPQAEEQELVSSSPPPLYFTPEDYEEALRVVRPSAMHDINLKPPPIRWTDIGGQDSVKTSLRRAVRLSTESADVLSKYFEHPPKGFLLYGPPGCSKTMAAQAMATESGLNFFAVKGAELLNMYVGESERAVRRLFQRAREVAPSMIFFDEIDAIAGQRQGFGHNNKGSGGSTTSHGGLNVLTTLLNEMDGFEALQGVVVLAATNRPQALDPALLRPGRFDELIYVSPPDKSARNAIFVGVAAKRRMNADVDVDKLARDTDGYSGAEIKGICAVAGIAAYDRYISGEGAAGEAEGIRMQDLENAIKGMKRQITREMIQGFEDWERQFRKF